MLDAKCWILDRCFWHAAFHGNGLIPGNAGLTRNPQTITRNTLNPTKPTNAVTRNPFKTQSLFKKKKNIPIIP
jgi:hypothetical protein